MRINENVKIWSGFLGGAIAWTLHLMSTYAIGEWGCILEGALFHFLGISAVGWLLIGVTIGTLALCAVSLVFTSRRRRSDNEADQFMGRAGFVLNLFFAGVIVAQAISIPILLGGC